ncbi:hypothetical protein PHMEG_00035089 [Phytophthora megakarya]|uniref:Uncharacterized protein n=1 Tax=Phytophthora megakarya TaxID=4795 RepID=A0A225UPU6_9STRA|nr:hypothetical protein PHMEG_00035089 [Phytophthora megakarya]
MIGKLLLYLLEDPDIHWQTSMNYLSSIKRQLEETTGTQLFRSDPDWYRRCRRHLQKSSATDDYQRLSSIATILFLKNDKKALFDRTLLNKQWLTIGRSSDVGMIHFSDLHWHGSFILIDLTR